MKLIHHWPRVAVAAFAVLGATAADAARVETRADGVTVRYGAEWVSAPVTPTTKTVDMQALPPAPEWQPGDPIVEIPRQFYGDPKAPIPVPANPVAGSDPLAARQREAGARTGGGFGTPVLNFNVLQGTAQPNDPTGDIGTLQYVAAINGPGGGQFAVYDKVTGNQVVAPTLMEGLGTGGVCASGLGDPIVVFDELASRWVITEFSTQAGNSLCVYISNTADLSGTVTWTRYAFTLPSFPDYPKYGVWPDAYYVGANEGGTGGARPLYAMNRVAMLAGQPATLQRLTTPSLSGFGFQMIQPADITGGAAPPAGSPGIFMRHRDDEVHNPAPNDPLRDFLQLYEYRVDWTTPANSSITGPIAVPIAEFSSNLNGLSAFEAFPQPSGTRLDPLRETVMHRLAYRNLGTYEALVGNLVTDLFLGAGSTFPDDTGAVRWFELRRSLGPGETLFLNGFEDSSPNPNPWTLHQEGTYAPTDGTPLEQADRWMAASSIDEAGNIGLAYNVVRQSPAISTGVRYTGRLASDPLGVMTEAEVTAVAGSASTSGIRWGDYADMGVDPVDGCTFWFVGNYSNAGVRSNRAVAFRHDACGSPTFTLSANPNAVSVCANAATPTPAAPVTLNAGTVNGFQAPVDLTFPNPFPTGVAGTTVPSTIATLPGTSTLTLTATNAATPGALPITVRGTSGAITRNSIVTLNVTTATPAAPTQTAPANNATGVSLTPTLQWTGAPQSGGFVVELATDAGFTNIVFTASPAAGSTGVAVSPALQTQTQYFWRVRSSNFCGNGPNSPVFSFTTRPPPGTCPAGTNPATLFTDNVETGTNGWTVSGTGAQNWTISTQRPFGGTGNSWFAPGLATTSDQRLTSPVIVLPSGQLPLTLQFQSDQTLEPDGAAACWDGGLIEITTNGGSTFTPLPASSMLTDPYNGPLSGGPAAPLPAWCGDPQAYLNSIVDLSDFAGQTVQLRFRLSTDTSVGRLGWFVDNIRVQSCAP
jgi:hypothetical protein